MHLRLPYPPSVNHYWIPIARYNARTRQYYGELVLSAAAKAYHAETGWAILSQRPKAHSWPYRVPVALTLHIAPPDHKRRDRDNILKAVCDTLVRAGVLADDSLIQELHLLSQPVCDQGRIELELVILGEVV